MSHLLLTRVRPRAVTAEGLEDAAMGVVVDLQSGAAITALPLS